MTLRAHNIFFKWNEITNFTKLNTFKTKIQQSKIPNLYVNIWVESDNQIPYLLIPTRLGDWTQLEYKISYTK